MAKPDASRPAPLDPRKAEAPAPRADVPIEDSVSRLLDRPPPAAYLEAWTRSLRSRLDGEDRAARLSLGLFRVRDELFALPTEHVLEVQPPTAIRSVPGRSAGVFRGLVSLRGEIHLCASVRSLLGIEDRSGQGGPEDDLDDGRRLLVVQHGGDKWALVVDEVLDFELFEAAEVGGAQVTVSKSAVHFTKGVVPTPHGHAALIDVERLFEGLGRSLLT